MYFGENEPGVGCCVKNGGGLFSIDEHDIDKSSWN